MTPNHVTREYSGIVLERLKQLPPGGKMGDLPKHLQHKSFVRTGSKKTGGPNLRLFRLEMNKPSLTVTAYIFNKFVHPTQPRYITPREAACLQDFPDNWAFFGRLGKVHHQVGNAVPVKLSEAIAKSVARFLLQHGFSGHIPIASYFCGAGGLDLGFEKASSIELSFSTEFCTDIDSDCGYTIEMNRPQWNFFLGDITKFSGELVLKKIGNSPVVVIGGPPCQPFSVAGKRQATANPLGRLYQNYIEHIAILKPEIVILENVYGLKQVKGVNIAQNIHSSFAEIGYHVKHQELLAADYGTPQMRRRLFFVATKYQNDFRFPEPTHFENPNLFAMPLYQGAGHSFAHLPPPEILKDLSKTELQQPPNLLRSLRISEFSR